MPTLTEILEVADKLIAVDITRGTSALRQQSQRIAESNNARGRLNSGMHRQEQCEAVGLELQRSTHAAMETYLNTISRSGFAVDDALVLEIKDRLKRLTAERKDSLVAGIEVQNYGVGTGGSKVAFSEFATSALAEADGQIDVWFLEHRENVRSVPRYGARVGSHLVDMWDVLHTTISAVARSRFDSGHYADAAFAAVKEVNDRVKDIHHAATGRELDGADLMHSALSTKHPTIRLGDDSETGRSMQVGYMEIFAGTMSGVRNPKAHHNLEISSERAVHFLFLASLLMGKIDEAEGASPV